MYTLFMSESHTSMPRPTDSAQHTEPACTTDRSSWPVWVGRVGEPQPKPDYTAFTPSQRIALCWEATKQAWILSGRELDESALCRDSESLSRRGG